MGELLVGERLTICSQDEYICFRSTKWLNRTKLAIEYCKNKENQERILYDGKGLGKIHTVELRESPIDRGLLSEMSGEPF
jgi:hypothetical protein